MPERDEEQQEEGRPATSVNGRSADRRHAGALGRRRLRRLAIRTIARTRSSSVERDSGIDPGPPERPGDRGLALRGGGLEALPEAPVVGVDVELLAGLGVLQDHRADVGQLDLARVRQADGEDLVAPVEQARAGAPSRAALMKSETTNTSERRLIACWPASRSGPRSVNGALASAAASSRSSMRRRTCGRPRRPGSSAGPCPP